MDPQLAEYRRKQQERTAAEAVRKSGTGQYQALAGAGVAVLLAVAAVYVGLGDVGASAATAAPGVDGVCPKPMGMGICVEECSSHADCQGQGKLCCSNGCGHVCTAPEKAGQAPKKQEQCVLMATLNDGADSEVLLQHVPAPSKKQMLSAVKILILNYLDTGHCCIARDVLGAQPDVKSVEFDGKVPACGASPGGAKERKLMGGWGEPRDVSEEQLALWRSVVEKQQTVDNTDLTALGKPVAVTSQVVAGTNYRFKFQDGTVVVVFHQPWTETLQVSQVILPPEL